MKLKKSFFVLYALCLVTAAMADKPRVKGYYVTNGGDSVEALIEIRLELFDKKKVSLANYLFGVSYFESGKKVELGENEVCRFGFMYMGQRYDFKFVQEIIVPAVMGHMDAKGTFLRLLVPGRCELYHATSIDGRTNEHFFKRGEGDNYLTKNASSLVSHDKDLVKFFADCPVLADKIKNKLYKGDERYLQMAKDYNSGCKAEQEE